MVLEHLLSYILPREKASVFSETLNPEKGLCEEKKATALEKVPCPPPPGARETVKVGGGAGLPCTCGAWSAGVFSEVRVFQVIV